MTAVLSMGPSFTTIILQQRQTLFPLPSLPKAFDLSFLIEISIHVEREKNIINFVIF